MQNLVCLVFEDIYIFYLNNNIYYTESNLKFICQISIYLKKKYREYSLTDGSKSIQALAIMLVIFLWFDHQFYNHHAFYEKYKA